MESTAGVFELGVPVLGICYGMQTMAQQLGGRWKAQASGSSAMPSQSETIRAFSTASRTAATTRVMVSSMCG